MPTRFGDASTSAGPYSRFDARLDLAAELERHELLAVTDAEHGNAEREEPGVALRRAVAVDALRAAAHHDRARRDRLDGLERNRAGLDLAVHVALADAARDELRVLRAVVEDENRFAGHDWVRTTTKCGGGLGGARCQLPGGTTSTTSRPARPISARNFASRPASRRAAGPAPRQSSTMRRRGSRRSAASARASSRSARATSALVAIPVAKRSKSARMRARAGSRWSRGAASADDQGGGARAPEHGRRSGRRQVGEGAIEPAPGSVQAEPRSPGPRAAGDPRSERAGPRGRRFRRSRPESS